MQNTYEPTNAKHPNYYLGDFRLRNLKGCVVTLVESFGALRLQGVSEAKRSERALMKTKKLAMLHPLRTKTKLKLNLTNQINSCDSLILLLLH